MSFLIDDLPHYELTLTEGNNGAGSSQDDPQTCGISHGVPNARYSDKCTICLSEFCMGDSLKRLPCFHPVSLNVN